MSKRAIENALWDSHKATIFDLYMEQRIGLKEVMKTMSSHYGFERKSVHCATTLGSIIRDIANEFAQQIPV